MRQRKQITPERATFMRHTSRVMCNRRIIFNFRGLAHNLESNLERLRVMMDGILGDD